MLHAHALLINEVMSNPVGDDGGREWIELYNNTESPVDVSSLTISIKGGSFIPVTPVAGGVSISPYGYAVIGSTVSGATKFMLDYPGYTGPLFKSVVSLVNTGVTSIEIKLQGVTSDTLSSYTAAKEGNTYSLINGTFMAGTPTPGEQNKEVVAQEEDATTSPTGSQATIPQMSPPSADIIIYLPSERVVVAGAPTLFSTFALTHSGKPIDAMTYAWSFGDGGERTGSTTTYRYFYPGRYVAQVEGTNGLVAGSGRMIVKVVSPDINISPITYGKYGSYIDITNPNNYDLDISGWKLSIDGGLFSFPKNTLLGVGVTHFPGLSMGFASTTIATSTLIKLMFPNMDEVVRVTQGKETPQTEVVSLQKNTPLVIKTVLQKIPTKQVHQASILAATPRSASSSSSTARIILAQNKKDTRIASFFRSLFK
jgi:hypothetical protein